MTMPGDVFPAPESHSFSRAADAPRRDEPADPISLAREINERRARVENTELLQNLRGL